MTLKEINEKVIFYEEELDWAASQLKKIDQILKLKANKKQINLIKYQKLKIEFFCFTTTSYIDILCTYRNLKRSKSNWEKFYNIKIAYLVAYETINTYQKYRNEIYKRMTKKEIEIFRGFFDMLNRELAEFKYVHDYEKTMSKIRNKSAAHYDKNFLTYYSSLEILEKIQWKNFIRSFLDFINPLHYFSFGLLKGELDELLFLNGWMS